MLTPEVYVYKPNHANSCSPCFWPHHVSKVCLVPFGLTLTESEMRHVSCVISGVCKEVCYGVKHMIKQWFSIVWNHGCLYRHHDIKFNNDKRNARFGLFFCLIQLCMTFRFSHLILLFWKLFIKISAGRLKMWKCFMTLVDIVIPSGI